MHENGKPELLPVDFPFLGWVEHIERPRPVRCEWDESLVGSDDVTTAIGIKDIYDPPESEPVEHGGSRDASFMAGEGFLCHLARDLGREAAGEMKRLKNCRVVQWPEFKIAQREDDSYLCVWYAESINERV